MHSCRPSLRCRCSQLALCKGYQFEATPATAPLGKCSIDTIDKSKYS